LGSAHLPGFVQEAAVIETMSALMESVSQILKNNEKQKGKTYE
jgi:hypothetical protein